MNRMRSFLLIALAGVASAALPLAVAETFDAALQAARGQMFGKGKDLQAARAAAATAAGLAATLAEKFSAAMLLGRIAEQAGDLGAAKAAFAEAGTLACLSSKQVAEALSAHAGIWRRERNFTKAAELYRQALDLPGLDAHHTQANLRLALAGVLENQGDWAGAKDLYRQVLGTEKLSDNLAFNALAGFARSEMQTGDEAAIQAAISAALGGKGSAAAKRTLLRDYAKLAAGRNGHAAALDAWKQILALPDTGGRNGVEAVNGVLDASFALNQVEDAREFAATAAMDARLDAASRLRTAIISIGLGPEAPAGLTLDAARQLAGLAKDAVKPEALAEICHEAGKCFMKLRRYPAVRKILEITAAMYRQEPPNVYQCRFVAQAPAGISGWLNSPLFASGARESRFSPYDQAAARLLVYDVNSGRDASDDTAAAAAPEKAETAFAMAADATGWHIFVKCGDPEAAKVAAGLLGGGQLEMFFQPGDGSAYHQWFVSFPEAEPDTVRWASPGRDWRPLDEFFKVQTAVLGDGFAALIFIPWEMLYDKLPRNGDRWPFGLMRWSRLARMTWGGKVHELNRFGRIEWAGLGPAEMLAVKRRIAMHACGRYRAVRNDIVSFWKDPEKGDPQFFLDTLLPLVQRLDTAGKRLEGEVSDTVVEELFGSAVSDWMEFPHLVSELRRKLLLARIFMAAGKGR